MRPLSVLFFLAAGLAAQPCRADEPWGYLWEVGNLSLHPLRGDLIEIGRLPSSNVVLSDGRVSRRHAEIRKDPGGVTVMDRGSTNGTSLNGQALIPGEAIPLGPGDLLVLAEQKLLYHEKLARLWVDALEYSLLGSFVRLRVPVLRDRTVTALGMERTEEAVSHAAVDAEAGGAQMSFPENAIREPGFQPEEVAFLGDVAVAESEIRLSLWGLARGGSPVSRRASFSHLKHGELRIGIAAPTRRDSQARFESGWSSEGFPFVLPLVDAVLQRLPEPETSELSLRFCSSLLEQDSATALRDAGRAFSLMHRLRRTDSDLPVLAAQAHARWVAKKARERRGNLSEQERSELASALVTSKDWVLKAAQLGADEKRIRKAEAEIAEAEKLISRTP